MNISFNKGGRSAFPVEVNENIFERLDQSAPVGSVVLPSCHAMLQLLEQESVMFVEWIDVIKQ